MVLGGGWAGGDCGVEVLLAGSSMHSSREGASKRSKRRKYEGKLCDMRYDKGVDEGVHAGSNEN